MPAVFFAVRRRSGLSSPFCVPAIRLVTVNKRKMTKNDMYMEKMNHAKIIFLSIINKKRKFGE